MKEGDWQCEHCGEWNFLRRQKCRQCRKPMPGMFTRDLKSDIALGTGYLGVVMAGPIGPAMPPGR